MEEVFYAVNVKTALKLAHVRGVALLQAAEAGLCSGRILAARSEDAAWSATAARKSIRCR